ncbi:MAG: UPF0149 family protein [Pseudomonadales bacterium]
MKLLLAWAQLQSNVELPVPDLSALALSAAHQLAPAELHGVVCGLAVCYGDDLPLQELVELVGVDALTDQRSVARFVAASLQNLEAPDMRFALLLPDDDENIASRLEALGQWCGSFLAGLAAGLARRGAHGVEDYPEEVREIVEDFTAIAQIDTDDLPADVGKGRNQAEADLLELEEFAKVGVLLIMSVLRNEADDTSE